MKNILLFSVDPSAWILILLGAAVFLFVLILIREIVCWYYKINERIELMKENNLLLRELITLNKENSTLVQKSNKEKSLNDPRIFNNL